VFHASNVESLIQQLPALVVLERSKIVPEKTRAQIQLIFRGLAALPQFKTAAFRNLDVLKDAFLSNDWIKRSNDSALETGMVEGLKLMMSDSVQGIKSSAAVPAVEPGARYSAWRWTRVVLEMRVEFKRLTMRITNNDDPVEARQLLARLVRSSLDREASPDDMDLLVEAFRGADTVVAQEILSVGLDRLGVLLSQLLSAEDQHQVEATALRVDLVLRVIGSVGRQDKTEPAPAAARDRLLNLLTITFQSIERRVTSEDELQLLPGAKPAESGDILKVAIKLLRFVLRVPPAEGNVPLQPAQGKPDYAVLVTAFLHLSVVSKQRSATC
jgi:mediator of RNA polymerase II transcription subunit 12